MIGAAIAGVALGFVVVAVLLGVVGGGDELTRRQRERVSRPRLHAEDGEGARGRAFDHAARRDVGQVEHGHADHRPPLRHRRHLRDLRGRARDRAGRPQPRARRHLHPLRRRGSRRHRDELRAFYDDHKTGTIMAPLDRLGDEFALGAWVVDGDTDSGFSRSARSSTRTRRPHSSARSNRGPERFDPSDLTRVTSPGIHSARRGVAERVRRARLKAGVPQGRAGSSPAPGTSGAIAERSGRVVGSSDRPALLAQCPPDHVEVTR